MPSRNLSLSLLVLLQTSPLTWGRATLVPPSTFPILASSTSGALMSTITSLSGSGIPSSSASASASETTQFPSLGGFSSCVTDCFADAVSVANCSTLVDVNCFCFSRKFSPALVGCIAGNCTSDQVTTGENLAQQFCNLASSSPTLSFPVISASSTASSTTLTNPSLTSSSSSTLTSPPSTSSTSSNSGVRPTYAEQGAFMGMGVTMVGVLLGIYAIQ